MILRGLEDSWLVVTQADHARLAADLLGLVRAPELVGHPRRGELLRAVADHDNGWWESDAAPRVDGEGRPVGFLHVALEERFEIWWRGVERYSERAPYRSAIVAAHALRLFAGRRDDPAWKEFLDRLEARREELCAAAGVALDELTADDRWTELADDLSLALCLADAGIVDAPGWRGTIEPSEEPLTLRVDPFPFAGATRLELRGRRIAARPWESDSALALALAAARWQRLDVRIAPLSG